MVNLMHLTVLAAVARHESVTAAAKELQYSQPSVSHHLFRLEAATGVKLLQKVGRGIRLTPEGRLLANRATEIVGRVNAATNELASLAEAHPALQVSVVDSHPLDSLRMLRHGEVDVALAFRYADAPVDDEGFRFSHLGQDATHLISQQPDDSLANHRDSDWIGGCAACQQELTALCGRESFHPRIASISDDMVVVQAALRRHLRRATRPARDRRADQGTARLRQVNDSGPNRPQATKTASTR